VLTPLSLTRRIAGHSMAEPSSPRREGTSPVTALLDFIHFLTKDAPKMSHLLSSS
jgi:hypothetical protein